MHASRGVRAFQGGACFPGGVCFLGVACLPGGVHASQGVHASWGVHASLEGACLWGGVWCGIPACTEADPPVNRITDTSKNIILATTSLRSVKILILESFTKRVMSLNNVIK